MSYVTMRRMPPLYRAKPGPDLEKAWADLEMPGYAPTFHLDIFLQDVGTLDYPGLMVILPTANALMTIALEDIDVPPPEPRALLLKVVDHACYEKEVDRYVGDYLATWGDTTALALRKRFPVGWDDSVLDDLDEDEEAEIDERDRDMMERLRGLTVGTSPTTELYVTPQAPSFTAEFDVEGGAR